MNEQQVEEELISKGLDSPRLNPALIDGKIKAAEYYVFGGTLTVCSLTLLNGFKVIGESSCTSPDNFNKELGEKVAYEDARNKVWLLEGYLLKQRLFEDANK